ncbi:MAG: carbohydrate ABC transporter substrate-binding protein [Eubacteriales bacterium]|nr:carbohydrate ABC transporter substrate-binding protein [Eubacteriales bacterium]
MNKKLISVLMATAVTASMAAVPTFAEDAEGTVLNIQCWNEEFKSRLTDHYPGYEEIDGTTGKIGDVTVKWTITPSDDNAYQNQLDTVLPENENASADEKTDLFLLEADYAKKYINSEVEVTVPVKDLGLTDEELAGQYQYTKDVVTDADGNLRGVSWQGCPGVLIYNREAAKEVFGSDDPETVQEKVKDWDTFNATAAELKEAGYNVMATVNDSYRVYSNNVTSPWVVDGKVQIDDNIMAWVEASKALVDAGETTTAELWSDDWSKGFYPDGKVFAYFGPAWLINFSMHADEEGSIANQGGWGAVVGPQGFYWGGTWIAAAKGTDNPTLVADIMRQLTTNEDIMKDIVKADSDFVNNKAAMEAAATDDAYAFSVLGGQNPLAMFCEGAESIDLSTMGDYDQGCNEEFQKAIKNYFDDNATLDEAIAQFKTAIVEKYPELTVD